MNEMPTLEGRTMSDLGRQLVVARNERDAARDRAEHWRQAHAVKCGELDAMRAERDALKAALLSARQGLVLAEQGNSDASCLGCYAEGNEHDAACCVGQALDAIDEWSR